MTDTITLPRQTAQQALEALETCGEDEWHNEDDFGMVQTYDEDKVSKAITALRTALEQQAEPVQERITHITWDGRGVRTVNGIPDDAPRCKELSEIQILDMMPSAIPAEYDGPLMEFARAVEAKLKERNK